MKLYYPKSQIQTNLYTIGKEFMIEYSNENYIGYYHKYIDNIYKTGAIPHSESKTLIPYMNNNDIISDNYIYNIILQKKKIKYIHPTPFHSLISLKSDLNNNKFIDRYFICPINDNTKIMEINEYQYKLWKQVGSGIDNQYYKAIKLNWKLTGEKFDIIDNITNTILEYGVYNSNKRTVESIEKVFKGISNYLINYIELSVYDKNIK